MRFLILNVFLGCDSLIFGMFNMIMNVELFCILKSILGLAGIGVQIYSLSSNKVSLDSF